MSMSINKRLLVVILSILASKAYAYGYSYSLPGAPTRPRSEAECRAISAQYNQVREQLESARSQCSDNMGSRYEPGTLKWIRAIKAECDPIGEERSRVVDEGIRVFNQCLANLKIVEEEAKQQQQDREALLRQQQEQKVQKYEVVDRKGQDVFIKPVTKQPESDSASQTSSQTGSGGLMQGDISARQVQRAIGLQSRALASDRTKLAMLQAGTGLLSTVTGSLMNEAMTSRNEHYDAVASGTNARIREMADLVGSGRGESRIITSIQRNSLREIGRQHNMILGDLEKIRRDVEGLKVGHSSGSTTSDFVYRNNPDPATRANTSNSVDSPQFNEYSGHNRELKGESADVYSPERERAASESRTRTEELMRVMEESKNDYLPGASHERSLPTRSHHEVRNSSGRHQSGGELARDSSSAGDTRESHDDMLAAGNARPDEACNFFNREADPRQSWHMAGTLVCRKDDMYRCQDGSWIFAGKCEKYPNWRSRTVDKVETFIR